MDNEVKDDRLDRLFADARKAGPYNLDIEYGFETRLMARVKAGREGRTLFPLWAWRLIPAFVSIVVLLGIWIFLSGSNAGIDLSAMAGTNGDETMITAYLAGK